MMKNSLIFDRAKIIFFVVICLLSLAVLIHLPRISVPLMISYVLFLMISPILPSSQSHGLSRSVVSFIVVILILFLIVYPLVQLIGYVGDESKNIQYYLPKIEKFFMIKYLELDVFVHSKFGISLDKQYIENTIQVVKLGSKNFLLRLPKFLASVLEWSFLVPIFLFFILRDGNSFKRKLLKLVPNIAYERFYFLMFQVQKKIGNYIFAKVIEALLVGIIITTGLYCLNVRFAALFGLIAGVTNIIPYLGPLLGGLPVVAFGLVEYGTSSELGAILILYMIANAFDIALVFPLLVSKIVDLHPVLVIFSVIIGSSYLGVMGMVVSIPLVVTFKLIFEEIVHEIYGQN